MQRSLVEVVTATTRLSEHTPNDTLLYYGTTSIFSADMIIVTPLGEWRYAIPTGSGVHLANLSDPGNPIKSGVFATQGTVVSRSRDGVKFMKDRPGGG